MGLRDRCIRGRALRSGIEPIGQRFDIRDGGVMLVEPPEVPDDAGDHVRGRRLTGEVPSGLRLRTPPTGVPESLFVEPDEPRRSSRCLEERQAVRILRRGRPS